MSTYKTATTIREKGELHLSALPFKEGALVEVTLVHREERRSGKERYPLRGKPFRYDRPTDPVAEDDWDALK